MDVLVALGTNAAVSNLHLHGNRKLPILVGILETQQSQLKTLADEHKRQEERIKVEYECWISGIRSLKDVINQVGSLSEREIYGQYIYSSLLARF